MAGAEGAAAAAAKMAAVLQAQDAPAAQVLQPADNPDVDIVPLRFGVKYASDAPTVMYVHCSAGCDRTGEFIGAYAMRYLGYNVTTAMGEACRQCGRCPNYFSSSALGWWCCLCS